MSTHDKQGRPYAKLSELKAGDTIELDGDFTCIGAIKTQIKKDDSGLYFECAEGGHHLRGHADDGEHCVGVYLCAEAAPRED